jgi:hypothetical protein
MCRILEYIYKRAYGVDNLEKSLFIILAILSKRGNNAIRPRRWAAFVMPPDSVSQLGETCPCLPLRACLSCVEIEQQQQPIKLINQFNGAGSFLRNQ